MKVELHKRLLDLINLQALDQMSRAQIEAEVGDIVYELLAKQQNVGADAVAAEAGKRAFRVAQPEHFLKLKDGKWVKRKDVKIE